MSELNKRQWLLYRFLKEKSGNGLYSNYNDILSDKTLSYIYRNNWNSTEAIRRVIRRDVNCLRNTKNPEIKIIIGSGTKGYKIPASEQETINWLNKRYKTLFRSLKLINHCKAKANLNGQYRFIEEGSKAKEYVEAFIKEMEGGK